MALHTSYCKDNLSSASPGLKGSDCDKSRYRGAQTILGRFFSPRRKLGENHFESLFENFCIVNLVASCKRSACHVMILQCFV